MREEGRGREREEGREEGSITLCVRQQKGAQRILV